MIFIKINSIKPFILSLFSLKTPTRNLGLDIIRAIAIGLVLFEHLGLNPYPIIRLGGFGVELFFVLSGFLIGGILLKEFDKFDGIKTIKHFWIKRWFRTLPLYYLALLLQIVLSKKIKWEYLYYFVFLQNNFYGINLFSVSWSLVIEEWFYLMLPFIFLGITLLIKKVKTLSIVFSILAFMLLKYFIINVNEMQIGAVHGNFLLRADTMLIGVLLASIKKELPLFFQKLAEIKFFIFSFISIVIIQFFGFVYFGVSEINKSVTIITLLYPLQSLCIALSFPFITDSSFINQKLYKIMPFSQFIVWTSILSYSFYLFHFNVFHSVQDIYSGPGLLILKIVALYLFSFFLYKLYEKPFTDLRNNFA